MIEPQKKGGRFFLGFTPPKRRFFPAGGLMSEWRRNVRMEEKRGNRNAFIRNQCEWPSGDYAMSEWRRNVRMEEKRGNCYLHWLWCGGGTSMYEAEIRCQPQRLCWCIWSASTSRAHLLQQLQESVSSSVGLSPDQPRLLCDHFCHWGQDFVKKNLKLTT